MTGVQTCALPIYDFLYSLEAIIDLRKKSTEGPSYVRQLFQKGVSKIAQKVGEEAVELVLEAKDTNDEQFMNEAADLLFHFLVLLNVKGHNLQGVVNVLEARHAKK